MHQHITSPELNDLVLEEPVARPHEGMPIGNGRMGTLVWTTPASVELQINRVDVFAVNRNAAGEHSPGPTDYCGGCARVSIGLGGGPLRAGPMFRQRLSLQEGRCTVTGQGVTAHGWVAAEDDLLMVTVTDDRARPAPIEVTLAMWRAPEVRNGAHTAACEFRHDDESVTVVQTFREADHYCSSAVVVAALSGEGTVGSPEPGSRTLELPAAPGTRSFLVSSAASWDERSDAGMAARQLLSAGSAPHALEAMEERHARWWREFWRRTSVTVESPDGRGERAARDRALFLYHMASSSRGPYPPKWNGSIFTGEGDGRAWGAQFWLWTTEMLYWPLHAADASDLAEPFFGMYRNALPAMETAARQRWNAEGFFLPETTPFDGPRELPGPLVEEYRHRLLYNPQGAEVSRALADCCQYDWHLEASTRRVDQASAGYAWISHLTSSGGELAVHAWWHYRHTGDQNWLQTHAYPLLRGVAEFYRGLARRGDDDRWHMHGTNAHEDFWGVSDSALANDAWAAGCLGAVDGSHNSEDVQLAPIFPFEDWTLETGDGAADAVARRTLSSVPRHREVQAGASLNTAIRSPIAAVRAGMGEELPEILGCYRAAFDPLPNGFSLFEGGTAPSIEHLGLLTMVLQEALLQSVAPRPGEPEIISVFPAWPRDWDVSFRLLARGGFLVSASMRSGQVAAVEIASRRGEECRLRNPWPHPCRVERDDRTVCARGRASEVVPFATCPGGRYALMSA